MDFETAPQPIHSVIGTFTKIRWNAFTLRHTVRERRFPFWPRERLLKLQNERVRSIVRHSYRNVPFYREWMRAAGMRVQDFQTAADLARLPVIDGKMYAKEPHRFQSDTIDEQRCLSIDSSGTSGRSKRILYDDRALFLSLAAGRRQNAVYGHFLGKQFGYRSLRIGRPGGVAIQIREFYEKRSWVPRGVDLKRQMLAPGDLPLTDMVAAINEFRPEFVEGYGSYLGSFMRQAHQAGLKIHRPRLIRYGGDGMPEADRSFIEQQMGVPVISSYQSVEALRIAFQCELREGFHLSMDSTAVRVIDDEGNDVAPGCDGHIVISNLTNRATVLLNYKLGDVVRLGKERCGCGRTLPTIEAIRGRSDDLLYTEDGRIVHGLLALESLRNQPGIVQVQIVQLAIDQFLLRVVGQQGVDQERARLALVEALRATTLRTSTVDVQWLESIPTGANGKVKAVVAEYEPPDRPR